MMSTTPRSLTLRRAQILTARSIFRLALLLCALAMNGCSHDEPPVYQGYAEGEFVRVAAPFAGNLEKLQVKRGDNITTGAPLFVLEQENEAAARHQAEERLHAAEAQLADLQKGKRPVELDVIKAQLAQAIAARQLSAAQLKRAQELVTQGFISKEALDTTRSTDNQNAARVAELTNQVKSAELAGRDDQIRAQAAEVDAARAALAQSDWQLKQKTVGASKTGLVFDTLYVEGEWVPAGSPVVSLLPPGNIKLRFFVPEAVVGSLMPGRAVEARCDGCGSAIPAKISYVSPQPEFTPPVIYSNDTRTKLVFLIEARPDTKDAMRLKPGQPVEVTLR